MFNRVRIWLAARRQRERAIGCAMEQFWRTRGRPPMGGHVLRLDARETIVRVMYLSGHVPPDRAWFAVPVDGGAIRELTFEAVETFESPWR
jgi:hypothetical protein